MQDTDIEVALVEEQRTAWDEPVGKKPTVERIAAMLAERMFGVIEHIGPVARDTAAQAQPFGTVELLVGNDAEEDMQQAICNSMGLERAIRTAWRVRNFDFHPCYDFFGL